MAVAEEIQHYLAYVLERLRPHGPITARGMFGGYAIYHEKTIFALIVEGELYFKVDSTNEKEYVSYQSHHFVYEKRGRPIAMPYMTLPEEILEDPKQLPTWIQKSVQASLNHKRQTKKPSRQGRRS